MRSISSGVPPHLHHSVSVFEKGGQRRLFDLPEVDLVRWSRELDETGEATVRLTPPSPGCAADLRNIRPMRHELVVFFDGRRAWEGPITYAKDNPAEYEIKAKDVSYYLNRMVMKDAYDSRLPEGRSESVIDRMLRIITAEGQRFEHPPLAINVLPYLMGIQRSTDPRTRRTTEPGEAYVFDELDSLAWRNGIDFGVVGRRIYLMDTDTPVGQVRRLTSDDFTSEVEIVMYGAELTTEASVTDRQGRFVSHGPGYSEFYGRVELLHGNYAEGDEPEVMAAVSIEEMTAQAARDFAPRYPLPMTVRVPENATMKHSTFIELHESLVPGVRVPLTAVGTVHEVSRLMKLKSLKVEESAGRVSSNVTLSPASESEAFVGPEEQQ